VFAALGEHTQDDSAGSTNKSGSAALHLQAANLGWKYHTELRCALLPMHLHSHVLRALSFIIIIIIIIKLPDHALSLLRCACLELAQLNRNLTASLLTLTVCGVQQADRAVSRFVGSRVYYTE
jgi:hypothetical protein